MPRPRVLTIAGSDSSGGAGIEADLKVLTAHGVYGMTAITALTAQNTQGVQDVHQIPIAFLEKTIKAVVEDIGVDVVKTGMLPSKECIKAVCEAVDRYKIERIVVDPVMISTSGHNLIPGDAIDSLKSNLLPRTFILTPNIPEAQRLVGCTEELVNIDDIIALGRKVQKLGPKWVLLKGGHCPLDKDWKVTKDEKVAAYSLDILIGEEETYKFSGPWIPSNNVHGTGCGLASAISANLALGKSLTETIESASTYIANSITAVTSTHNQLGHGNGPVDFAHGIIPRLFAPGHFLAYLKSHPQMPTLWKQYTYHPFVEKLRLNTLPLSAFKRYLAQDYLFLSHYARAITLQSFKQSTFAGVLKASGALQLVKHEIDRNLALNAQLGITEDDILAQEESLACKAYSRFLVDVAVTEAPVVLLAAFMPCLYGYFEIGRRIVRVDEFKGRKIYAEWAGTYGADDYAEAIVGAEKELEAAAARAGTAEMERCRWAFREATKLEIEFWNEPVANFTEDE